MTTLCDLVSEFADGEILDEETANKFRDHLKTCPTCPRELELTMEIMAALSTLKPLRRDGGDS